jgi:TetR/AcrR family transcriptional repressor of nem operon
MPRASKAEMERNREEIERVSSRLIRERGLAVSLADLMGAAGLTHGGFYNHFASKDELAAVACARAFDESTERWKKRAMSGADAPGARAALIDGYLNAYNRNNPGSSCPMAALAVDVAREGSDKEVANAFRHGFEGLVDILADHQPGETDVERGNKSLVDIATMVGALILARATKGSAISNEILESTRHALLEKHDA